LFTHLTPSFLARMCACECRDRDHLQSLTVETPPGSSATSPEVEEAYDIPTRLWSDHVRSAKYADLPPYGATGRAQWTRSGRNVSGRAVGPANRGTLWAALRPEVKLDRLRSLPPLFRHNSTHECAHLFSRWPRSTETIQVALRVSRLFRSTRC